MLLNEKLSAYHVILGSQSPRRRALLGELGIPFEARSKDIDESFPKDLEIEKVAEYLACKKAEAFEAELNANDLLITSDTTVCLPDEILNKASSEAEAKEMLIKLSGKSHQVISGVCIKTKTKSISFSESTKVYFKVLSEEEIEYYIEHYQPFDKAGAYGIQEWIGFIGIEKIEGDYYNVMGLPMQHLYEELLIHA